MSTGHPTPDLAAALAQARKPTKRKPTSRIDRLRQRKKPLIAIRQNEMVRLLEACVPLRPGPTSEISAARLRCAMAILDRTGMRVSELLDLVESDLVPDDSTIVIRNGKGGKRRLVGMDAWGWGELDAWLEIRNREIPSGYLLPVVQGRTAGAKWADCDLRRQLNAAARRAGLAHTAHPHAWRHGWAVRARREGIDLVSLQSQLGHTDLTTTSIYLDTIDPLERLQPVISRPAPMIELPHSRHPRRPDGLQQPAGSARRRQGACP